jgi:hypothetical protein
MTLYNVHIYREMRLFFPGIEAGTPDEAAKIAADKQTADAECTEDCDGENLAALIDVQGDDDFSQSVTIDFEHERLRKTAPDLLEALQRAEYLMRRVYEGDHHALENLLSAAAQARAAIAKATAIHQPTIERRMP